MHDIHLNPWGVEGLRRSWAITLTSPDTFWKGSVASVQLEQEIDPSVLTCHNKRTRKSVIQPYG